MIRSLAGALWFAARSWPAALKPSFGRAADGGRRYREPSSSPHPSARSFVEVGGRSSSGPSASSSGWVTGPASCPPSSPWPMRDTARSCTSSTSAQHLEEIRRVTSRAVRARHRERTRPPGPPDALRGPRVCSSQGASPTLRWLVARMPIGRPGSKATAPPSSSQRAAWRWVSSSSETSTRPSDGSTRPPQRSPPLPLASRSIQLETWRGRVRAGAGDAEGMRQHLDRAVAIATEAGQASARCDALARLAVEAARSSPTIATTVAPTRSSSSSSSDRRPT